METKITIDDLEKFADEVTASYAQTELSPLTKLVDQWLDEGRAVILEKNERGFVMFKVTGADTFRAARIREAKHEDK